MNKILKAIKGYGQVSSNDTLFGDRCFSGVKTA